MPSSPPPAPSTETSTLAWSSPPTHGGGVDLVAALLEVATGQRPAAQPPGPAGVATHQLLLAVLGAAQHRHTRRAVLAEQASASFHRGSYHGSVEELTPVRHDLRAALPVMAASVATLARPATWRWFSAGAVANYALTPAAWREILHHPGP
jgi:hypothetical protein